MNSIANAELDAVFGSDSTGNLVSERALSSRRSFVRSQVQLATDSPRATGHRLSAWEALNAFGWNVLLTVAQEDSVSLVKKADEPAATFRRRREALNLSVDEVAKVARLSPDTVEAAEIPGRVLPIRDLETLARVLALDEYALGQPGARGDDALGVRLREMSQAKSKYNLGTRDVLGLVDAAWLVAKQTELAKVIESANQVRLRNAFAPDDIYEYPTHRHGYRLALETRHRLGLSEDEPIHLRKLLEETLLVPVIQQGLSSRIAGATIANGTSRGIVVNEDGLNRNIYVRRMTIAHELGHLLWDADGQLNKLAVDEYTDLEADYASPKIDPVEMRANAFAVSFLAPPIAVNRIASSAGSKTEAVATLMENYGISATAAKYHIQNITKEDVTGVSLRGVPDGSEKWTALENMTVDWFPIRDTPISRRGRFSYYVAAGVEGGYLSVDTAASYLCCTPELFEEHRRQILDTFQLPSSSRMFPSFPTDAGD